LETPAPPLIINNSETIISSSSSVQENNTKIVYFNTSQKHCCTNFTKETQATYKSRQLTLQQTVKLSFLRHSSSVFTVHWPSMSQQKSPQVRKCVHMRGVTSDFFVSEGLVDPHSVRGQTKGSEFIQALLCSILRHNLWTQLPIARLL
jgi:hypothetical protein